MSGVRVRVDALADLHERGGLGGARPRTDAEDHGHLRPESTNRRRSYEHRSEIRCIATGSGRRRRRLAVSRGGPSRDTATWELMIHTRVRGDPADRKYVQGDRSSSRATGVARPPTAGPAGARWRSARRGRSAWPVGRGRSTVATASTVTTAPIPAAPGWSPGSPPRRSPRCRTGRTAERAPGQPCVSTCPRAGCPVPRSSSPR
jgi:hypothetical protein